MIIPTVFDKNYRQAEEKINRAIKLTRWLQIDVTDGIFTEGKTFELELLAETNEQLSALLDIHLMTKEPISWINKCMFVGASRIIGQVEMMSNRKEFVNRVKNEGMEAGLAFDIETEIGDIPQDTDVVLIMARKAGFGDRPIDERVWGKIEQAISLRNTREGQYAVGVDGGISEDNIDKFDKAGVNIFYCGKAIWEGDKMESNWLKLNGKINDK